MSAGGWAVRLPRASARAAAALRLAPGLRVRVDGDDVWLRGDRLDEGLDLELRKLPGGVRHSVDAAGRYTEIGRLIPSGTLPPEPWLPLSDWLAFDPQPAALSGLPPARVPFRLHRSGSERPATVLITRTGAWAAYASTAAAVRLRPLAFAACADGRAVVRGTPLPPVPGRRYAEQDGVAVPCGFAWSPAVEPAAVRDLLGLAPGDLALLDESGDCEVINAHHFARATRAAARASSPEPRP